MTSLSLLTITDRRSSSLNSSGTTSTTPHPSPVQDPLIRPLPNPSAGPGTLTPLLNHFGSGLTVLHAEQPQQGSGFSVFGIAICGGGGTAGKSKDGVKSQPEVLSNLKKHSGISTPLLGVPTSWWGGKQDMGVGEHRPWRDLPNKIVPAGQTEGWLHTRERVGQAVASVLDTTVDVLHEVLSIGTEVFKSAPVPGLAPAAYVLLEIWDSLQMVDTNRLQCLRLTGRCANILLSVREEIKDAGDEVAEELHAPITKLTESFTLVQAFLLKQVRRPFLKRYLKRDEIQAQIQECDAGLSEALDMFGLSIQIRILKNAQEAAKRQNEDARLWERILTLSTSLDGLHSQILPTLKAVMATQDALDRARDNDDLRALMYTALRAGSDTEMLQVMQIRSEEMLEAIKTLQRVLERFRDVDGGADMGREVPKEEDPSKSPGRITVNGSGMTNEEVAIGPPPGYEDVVWHDNLDREFIESGIDALRWMSRGAGIATSSLPPWTITRYEVDREQQISVGFFSDLYRGTWHGQTVAIKVLAATTPKDLFLRKVQVWRELRHPNVLELYGASSASGERPWFFVCAYMKRGSLIDFLQEVEQGLEDGSGNGRVAFPILEERPEMLSPPGLGSISQRSPSPSKMQDKNVVQRGGDLFRYMLEIAQGMEYLHANGALHGELKAANVLVDDDMHCVISDFGLSQMKSEVYRLSGATLPCSTLRWQAPELMSSENQLALTPQMDIYAYAMTCVEILSMGKLPWPLADDNAVRRFVLRENLRPALPFSRFNNPSLQELLRVCWHKNPSLRPSFETIVWNVKAMRQVFLNDATNAAEEQKLTHLSPPSVIDSSQWYWERDHSILRTSPDMRPLPLSIDTPPTPDALMEHSAKSDSPATIDTFFTVEGSPSEEGPSSSTELVQQELDSYLEDTVLSGNIGVSEPAFYTQSSSSSLASSVLTRTFSNSSLKDLELAAPEHSIETKGCDSSVHQDERIKLMRDERRYRLLLRHEFHQSLTLPLWEPSPVKLGAVGYLSKPKGRFVTLFNSFSPEKDVMSAVHGLPSLYEYGRVSLGRECQDRRNVAQRGCNAFAGLLTFRRKSGVVASQNVVRRYSFPLRAGHAEAHMFTESTMYHYMASSEVPKKWFKANVDAIMQIYGPIHHIQKEDLFLVIGTLDAQEYALFVSHTHPDGQTHFNVFSNHRKDQPWGTFTTDTKFSPNQGGPSYDEPIPGHADSSSKVSKVGQNWDTVVIARLRFKPDVLEPTSL